MINPWDNPKDTLAPVAGLFQEIRRLDEIIPNLTERTHIENAHIARAHILEQLAAYFTQQKELSQNIAGTF